MNFHRNKKTKFSTIAIFAFTVFVILIVIVPVFRGLASSGIIGVGHFFWSAKNNFFGKIRGEEVNQKDIERLELENRFLQEENNRLKNLLSNKPSSGDNILSSVLSRPPYSPYDTFIIEGGIDVGISVGDYVFADDLAVVGVVQEVNSNTSKVTLFSSYNVKTKVLLGESAVSLSAVGRGGQNLTIEVPQGVSFEEGDIAYLPQVKGAVVGVIDKIKTTEGETTQTLFLRSPINMQELQFVIVSK